MDLKRKSLERPSVSSHDGDVNKAPTGARSQLRKRFDLGGNTSAQTAPNVFHFETVRPKSPATLDDKPVSRRPTMPTPRPRVGLSCVARRLVDDKQMLSLPLDSRAAFILQHIDGHTKVSTIIDMAAMMSPEEVVSLVERLAELQAIEFV